MKKVHKKHRDKTGLELARTAGRAALEKKAERLVILDVRGRASFTDYFVVMSGRSSRHVQGLAEAVDRAVGSKRIKSSHTEGLVEGHWVLLDYNEVIVHVFCSDVREFYDLEGLWHDAPRVAVEPETPGVPGRAAGKKKEPGCRR